MVPVTVTSPIALIHRTKQKVLRHLIGQFGSLICIISINQFHWFSFVSRFIQPGLSSWHLTLDLKQPSGPHPLSSGLEPHQACRASCHLLEALEIKIKVLKKKKNFFQI